MDFAPVWVILEVRQPHSLWPGSRSSEIASGHHSCVPHARTPQNSPNRPYEAFALFVWNGVRIHAAILLGRGCVFAGEYSPQSPQSPYHAHNATLRLRPSLPSPTLPPRTMFRSTPAQRKTLASSRRTSDLTRCTKSSSFALFPTLVGPGKVQG